jgi:ADP-heptose:LPS heptosyltransferase
LKNILLIKHGSLGDIISATSVMHDIRNHYKNDKLIILTMKKYKSFLEGSNFFDKILIDDRKNFFSTILIITKILQFKFDLAIDLQNSKRTSIYALLLRLLSKIKINGTGPHSTHRYQSLSKKLPSVINGLSNQVEILGIKTTRKPFLDWLNKDPFNFKNLINQNFIIINPGCSKKNFQKKWPAENYAKLCSYLISINILPIIIGSYLDQEVVKIIERKEKKILNLLNKSPLDVIFQLSQKAIGAISNDTGPAHLMAASGCKIHLLLSSFSNVNTVIPQGDNVSYTQQKMIENIQVEDVIKKLNKIFFI